MGKANKPFYIKIISETENTVTIDRASFNELLQQIEDLKAELAQLKRIIFGSKKEGFISEENKKQPELPLEFAEEEKTTESNIDIPTGIPVSYIREQPSTKPNKAHGRELLPAHLRREEIVIEPNEIPEGSKKIGAEITESLEYKEAEIFVKRIIRNKYALPQEEGVIIASMPNQVLPKMIAGGSLLAYIIVSKYVDHLPIYRQLGIFNRLGVNLNDSTVGGWIGQVSSTLLSKLYDEYKKILLKNNYLQVDETPIKILDKDKKGKTHQGYLWAIHDPVNKMALFKYDKTRSKSVPLDFFEKYKGALQTDGYSGYVELGNKDYIVHLACMAHARRKFEQSLDNDKKRSEQALILIQELYKIERQAKEENLTFEQRKELRLEKAKPILEKFKIWLDTNRKYVLPKSSIGKAIDYTLNLWLKLNDYLLDGRYEIDNNLIENKIRPIAIGKKNYLFIGSHDAAQNTAIIYTLLANCKLNDINPSEWLNDILPKINEAKTNELIDLLPHNWKK